MSQTLSSQPLGTVLLQADLVSATQIESALQEQMRFKNKRLGEILALRGWIKQKTADFFAEGLPALQNGHSKQPLGQYLKEAALLNEEQITTILREQKQTGLRFGELAVKKGWLRSTTVDFFLNFLGGRQLKSGQNSHLKHQGFSESSEHLETIRQRLLANQQCEPLRLLRLYRQVLCHAEIVAKDTPEQAELLAMGLVIKQQGKLRVSDRIYQSVLNRGWVEQELANLQPFSQIRLKLFKLKEKANYPYSVLEEILNWTGEQFYLTQKLCQLIAESDVFIIAGEEVKQVEQIVRDRIIARWQEQSAGEHLKTIEQRLLNRRQGELLPLLKRYRQILLQENIFTDGSLEQIELLKIGLVKEQQGKLSVANPIYKEVFNLAWVEGELLHLQSYLLQIKLSRLTKKADYPYSVLEEILNWTGEQPYLTQKLSQLIAESDSFIPAGEEVKQVEQIVRDRIIDNWKFQSAKEHLQTIEQRLFNPQQCGSLQLLRRYRQILRQENIFIDGSPEQIELLEIGLVKEQQGKLSVANPIYEEVFNLAWVEEELLRLESHRLRFKLLSLKEKASYPYSVLEEILNWTGEQPYLTQKLSQLIAESDSFIPAGEEVKQVEQIVRDRIINNWEFQSAGEHLRKIQQRSLENSQDKPLRLLKLYQQILCQRDIIADSTPEQLELLEIGLIKEQKSRAVVANRIYEEVFNLVWVEQALANASPPSRVAPIEEPQPLAVVPIELYQRTQEKPKKKNRTLQLLLLLGAIAGATLAGFYLLFQRQELEFFQQGNELLHQGKYQQAISKYDEVIAGDANYYQAWTNRGYALAGLRQYDQMLNSCATATIIEPKATYAWNCQGEALHNLKQYDEAIAAFDKAIAIDARDPVFWINKSESLLSSKNPQEALITSERAIEILQAIEQANGSESIKREFSIALTSKARALRENQQYAEALEAYNRALKYSPDYFPAQRGKGMTLQNLGRSQEAISAFDRIINSPNKSDGQKAEALFFKGLTLCELQEYQAAFSALEEAIKLKPNYQEAKNAKMTCGY